MRHEDDADSRLNNEWQYHNHNKYPLVLDPHRVDKSVKEFVRGFCLITDWILIDTLHEHLQVVLLLAGWAFEQPLYAKQFHHYLELSRFFPE